MLFSISNLCGLGITCLLHLKLLLLGETNTEHPQKISISGLNINMSLDHGLPFLDHGAQFVAGQVHAMEVGQNITSLDFLSHEFELPEGHFIILKVSQGDLKHTPLQTVRCNSCKSKLRMTYPIGDTRVVIGEIYYVKLVTIKLKFQNHC